MEEPVIENLTPVQQLDRVLYILTLSPRKNHLGIQSYLLNFYHAEWSLDDILMICRKLKKDGYVDAPTTDTFEITFDGKVFHQLGGYNSKILADQAIQNDIVARQSRLTFVEDQTIENGRSLNTLTDRLVSATRFAAWAAIALFVWDVLKFLLERPCQK